LAIASAAAICKMHDVEEGSIEDILGTARNYLVGGFSPKLGRDVKCM
jgi:2-methylcitrate dehydratase PrpD